MIEVITSFFSYMISSPEMATIFGSLITAVSSIIGIIVTYYITNKQNEKEIEIKNKEIQNQKEQHKNDLKIKNIEIQNQKEKYEKELEIKKIEIQNQNDKYEKNLEIKNIEIQSQKEQHDEDLEIKNKEIQTQKEHYEAELELKNNEIQTQKDQFEDLLIYISNYPHEIHSLIKLNRILVDLIKDYETYNKIGVPILKINEELKKNYQKFIKFKNSPLYYYLDEKIKLDIIHIFKNISEKINHDKNAFDGTYYKFGVTYLSNNEINEIKKINDEISEKIHEEIKK